MTVAVVFAYHDVGVRCLSAVIDCGVEVAFVVTHGDDPNEGGWFASVADSACANGIEVLVDPDEEQLDARLNVSAVDFIFSFYYRRMLPQKILSRARCGAFNMHGSLLPKYRGRAPINWAILNGESETGATLHVMTDKPDAGPIVDQEAVTIGPDDLAVDVYRRVVAAAERVMRRTLPDLLAGRAALRPQDLSRGSYFGGRRPEDGEIDWTWSAVRIHNLVRAVAPPYPGAYAGALRIYRTRLESGRLAPPGPVGPYREDGALFAKCGDGIVLRLIETAGMK